MTSDTGSNRLLVIESERGLSEALNAYFLEAGYQVLAAADGAAGVELALSAHPQLILLASRLPDIAGLDVFRRLRNQPRTGHIPVMMLAARDDAMRQNEILEEGVYDFIEKPVDLDILGLRVRNALRRAEREGLTEPRTGLPTGRLIDERLDRLRNQRGWCRIDLSIAEFGTFRDLYGFVTANESLRFAGTLILDVIHELGTAQDFVGHRRNSEEFVIVTERDRCQRLAGALTERITGELASFYNFMERDQGFVLVDDGGGGQIEKPLMSAQVTVTADDPADSDPWVDAD